MRLAPVLAALLALMALPAWAGNVGFQQLTIANGSDTPLKIAVWYPTAAAAAPTPLGPYVQSVAPDAPMAGDHLALVVISHGTSGTLASHIDTALTLARAGFVVAALNHTGDTYGDLSRQVDIWGRPAMLRRLIDYMLAEWPGHGHIDANRVGAFGFSAGAFTVLAEAGGVPDLAKVNPHCAVHPGFFECGIVKAAGGFKVPPASTWFRDARIRALVVAAPALGYTFGRTGLKGVTVPVQLWRDANDHVLPSPYYAQPVRDDLPTAPEYHVVPGADHDDFLAPCTATLAKAAPDICQEGPGFDRAAFHATFDAAVVRFFERTLR